MRFKTLAERSHSALVTGEVPASFNVNIFEKIICHMLLSPSHKSLVAITGQHAKRSLSIFGALRQPGQNLEGYYRKYRLDL